MADSFLRLFGRFLAFNWVVSGIASFVLWLVVILFLAFPAELDTFFNVKGKPWVSEQYRAF
jgi:hypothetical protein